MAYNSRRSARRSIITAAVSLLALAPLVSCGSGGNNCGVFCQVAGPVGHPAPVQQPTPPPSASTGSEVRLGCGTYCQAAGILNGGAGEGQPAVTIDSGGAVTADADSHVPVVLKCNLQVQCRGSLVLAVERGFDQGKPDSRSDLVVDAGATTTLGIPLGTVALPWLQSHGSAVFAVIADAGPSFGCDGRIYQGETRTGLPPCGYPPVHGYAVITSSTLKVLAAR